MSFITDSITLFFTSDLITYCMSSIWIISLALIFCYFFNKKIKDTLVLSFIVSFVLLFFGGIIGNIYLFYIIGWIIIILFYGFVIYKKKLFDLIKGIDLFTILIYLLFSLIIFIYYQKAGFRFTDEYMHWGPMVKELFRTNQFYCSDESMLLVHKDYPPFFSLIELLFCFFGRGYVEKYLYIGLLSFVLAIIISISFNNKNKVLSFIGLLLLGFIFQYIPSIQDSTSIYNSIYIDYAMSLLFVFVINYLIRVEQFDNFDNKLLALCFTALLLSKQIGILYFALCILYMLVFTKHKKIKMLISIFMPIIFFGIWKMIVINNGIVGQFSINNVSLRTESNDILRVFIKALINRPLFIKPFFICSLLIFAIVLVSLFFADKRVFIIYSVGLVSYLFTICLLYMFVFSVEEAMVLSSFERYIISYVYIGISLLVICVCDLNRIIDYLILYVAILFICDFKNSNINNILDKKRILVINQQGAKTEFNFNQTTGSIYSFDFSDYLYEGDADKFLKDANKYDYVYVYLYDDNFYRIWVDMTNDKSLENDSLFYIQNRNPLTFENSNFNMIYYVIKYCINEIDE